MDIQSSFDDGFDDIRAAILRAALDLRAGQDVVRLIATRVGAGAAGFFGHDVFCLGDDCSIIAGYDPAAPASLNP